MVEALMLLINRMRDLLRILARSALDFHKHSHGLFSLHRRAIFGLHAKMENHLDRGVLPLQAIRAATSNFVCWVSNSKAGIRAIRSWSVPLAVLIALIVLLRQATAQDLLIDGAGITTMTSDGSVEGRKDAGMTVFRGIPYAAAPIGSLRFKPPVAHKRWGARLRSWARTAACAQLQDNSDPAEDGEAVMSEDCLTLNVWTPGVDAARRPIMVFIHGGAFIEGSAADSWYDGATLAARGDVVVITLQYRLGVFGFLELGDIGGADYAQSGNLGILDQISALRWVQKNAASFGGDSANVTVFGESAGGASIYGLLATPLAKGLFHKAIIESGDPAQFKSREQALQVSREVQDASHAHTVAELQRLRTADLLRVQAKLFERPNFDMSAFTMVEDGVVFGGTPIEEIERDRAAGLPLLIGTNSEEMRYIVAMDASPIDLQPRDALRQRLKTLFGTPGASLIDVYDKYSQSSQETTTTLLGDAIFRMPALRLADINSSRQPTYVYMFTFRSLTKGPSGLEYGSMHGLELAPLFHVDSLMGYTYVGPKGSWSVLSEQMMAAWTSFARTGDPNNSLLPLWPQYEIARRATMGLGVHSDVMLDPFGAERQAWNDIPTDVLENVNVIALWDLPSP